MARGHHPRPQSGSAISQRTRGGGGGGGGGELFGDKHAGVDVTEHQRGIGNNSTTSAMTTIPASPSKMVQGICDNDDDGDEDNAERNGDAKHPGQQRVRGYMLQNYTTVQVTNRQKPLPGYPPDYQHDPSSPLPPPGYPLNYVSRKVQVVPDGRGRLTKNIVTQQPQSERAKADDDNDNNVNVDAEKTSPEETRQKQQQQKRPSTLLETPASRQPFVPPGILGPSTEEYSTSSKRTTTTATSGLKSNCTTPGSFSAEWNYEFVHEKSYVYIEALKYSSSSPNVDGVVANDIGQPFSMTPPVNQGNGTNDTFDVAPTMTSSMISSKTTTKNHDNDDSGGVDRPAKSNVEIYKYLDNDVLANALCAMPYRGGEVGGSYHYYGSVKEKKQKKNRDGKKSWIESLNSSSSSSEEKARNHASKSSSSHHHNRSYNVSSVVGCDKITNNHEGETTTEGLGSSSSGPDASSSSPASGSASKSLNKSTERKMASTSKLTGILSRLSPKLIHRRSSSTGRILLTTADSAVDISADGGGPVKTINREHRRRPHRDEDSDDTPSNVEISTSGVSDVSGEGGGDGGGGPDSSTNSATTSAKTEEGHSSQKPRRGRSPVRNFFRKSFSSSQQQQQQQQSQPHNDAVTADDGDASSVADSASASSSIAKRKKSPSRNRLLTSFRSASSHKDKDKEESSKGDRKSDTSSTTSQFSSISRRLRKSSRDMRGGGGGGDDVRKDKSRDSRDCNKTALVGVGSSSATKTSSNCQINVVHQQKICQSEGAILVSSGGGRKYHVVEIPIDDEDDDDKSKRSSLNKSEKINVEVDGVEEENPEEEEVVEPSPTRKTNASSSYKPRRNTAVPPPLPPHGAKGGANGHTHKPHVVPNPSTAPPVSLRLSSAPGGVAMDKNAAAQGPDNHQHQSRLQDVSIGECSIIDMNLSAGSTTVADGSLDYDEDDPRLDPYFGSQATLEPDAEARSSTTLHQVASATAGAFPQQFHQQQQNYYRGVFSPITGGSFQASSSLLGSRNSPLASSSGRLHSTPTAIASSATPSAASSHHVFSPMSPIGGSSSLCSSSVSSQPIPVSSGVPSCHDVKSQLTSIYSNSIGSPPSEGGLTTDPSSSQPASASTATTSGSSSAASRKPSYLSISMSVSGYSHYRRTGTSLSLQPGRTFSSSSLASRGSGSLASVGSSAFSYSTNDASHASHYSSSGGRAREASGGSGVAGSGGASSTSAWRGSSVPPLGRETQHNNKRQPGDGEPIVESTSVEVVPLSACLMDKLCLGCGPASPPPSVSAAAASTRSSDGKRQKCIQQQQCLQQREHWQQPRDIHQRGRRGSQDVPSSSDDVVKVTTTAKDLSSSSSSSSSRRESHVDPFAVSSQQRNTVIRLSPDEPSTATISTSAADRGGSSEEATVVLQPPEEHDIASSLSKTPAGVEITTSSASARESVVLEALEIVERIKRAERLKLMEQRSSLECDKVEGAVSSNVDNGKEEVIDYEMKRDEDARDSNVPSGIENGESSRSIHELTTTSEVFNDAPSSLPNKTGLTPDTPIYSNPDQMNGGENTRVGADDNNDDNESILKKNGKYFTQVVLSHESRISKLCAELESFLPENHVDDSNVEPSAKAVVPSEDACGKIRACIGKAHLLTSKKFKQFKGLCEKNLSPANGEDPFPTTNDDLAGFWDLVLIQIEEIDAMHREILQLKANDWKQKRNDEKKKPTTTTTTRRVAKPMNDEQAAAASAAAAARAKAREDARKKLINSKRMQLKQQKLLQNQADHAV